MAKTTLIKYLEYLIAEINHHVTDKQATDDELIRFSAEFKKFRSLIEKSENLPPFIKAELLRIDFCYDISKTRKRNFLFILKLIFTAPYYAHMNKVEQEKRVSELLDAFGDLKRVYNKVLYIQDINKCYI